MDWHALIQTTADCFTKYGSTLLSLIAAVAAVAGVVHSIKVHKETRRHRQQDLKTYKKHKKEERDNRWYDNRAQELLYKIRGSLADMDRILSKPIPDTDNQGIHCLYDILDHGRHCQRTDEIERALDALCVPFSKFATALAQYQSDIMGRKKVCGIHMEHGELARRYLRLFQAMRYDSFPLTAAKTLLVEADVIDEEPLT